MKNGPTITIQPALTAQQWNEYRERRLTFDPGLDDIVAHPDPAFPARAIAIANDLLPAGDPRKLTRARVNRLREAAERLDQLGKPSPAWELWRIADVLDSYLPRGE